MSFRSIEQEPEIELLRKFYWVINIFWATGFRFIRSFLWSIQSAEYTERKSWSRAWFVWADTQSVSFTEVPGLSNREKVVILANVVQEQLNGYLGLQYTANRREELDFILRKATLTGEGIRSLFIDIDVNINHCVEMLYGQWFAYFIQINLGYFDVR